MNMEGKERKAKYQLTKESSTIDQSHENKEKNDLEHYLRQVKLSITIKMSSTHGKDKSKEP